MRAWHLLTLLVAAGSIGLAPSVQAGTMPPVVTLAAHDAESLASRIQADARRGGPAAMTSVKVVKGCCGVRGLELYERARAGSFARYGAYYLEVVTGRGGKLEKVRIIEYPTHRGYNFTGEASSRTYSFGIAPTMGQWSIVTGHAYHPDDRYTTAKVAYHYEEAQLTTAELQALYTQALTVLTKAEHHAPVSQETYLHPGLPCGLPENQACEPGGRW
jgi:hypothetical protein